VIDPIKAGDRVVCLHDEEPSWSTTKPLYRTGQRGVAVEVTRARSVLVRFDDSDMAYQVEPEHLRVLDVVELIGELNG
jgi:hypothetical protein